MVIPVGPAGTKRPAAGTLASAELLTGWLRIVHPPRPAASRSARRQPLRTSIRPFSTLIVPSQSVGAESLCPKVTRKVKGVEKPASCA